MEEVFIATEDDGSQWVMLEDYQALQQKYLLGELALEEQIKRNSALLQAAQQGARRMACRLMSGVPRVYLSSDHSSSLPSAQAPDPSTLPPHTD